MAHTEEDQRRKQPPVGGVQATEPPDFLESVAMADCLAQKFVSAYPSKEPNPKWRGFLQQWVVPGIRWLWRNGSLDTRTSIATRIAIWRGLEQENVREIRKRIQTREAQRATQAQPKGGE